MEYQIKLIDDTFTIMGLPYIDYVGGEFVETDPDYSMVLVGLHSYMDNEAECLNEIYRELYDISQTHEGIKPGDAFVVQPVKYGRKKIKLPRQEFFLDGFHLVPLHALPKIEREQNAYY